MRPLLRCWRINGERLHYDSNVYSDVLFLYQSDDSIHILTGNGVTSVRLFYRGTLSDQKRDFIPPRPKAKGKRSLFWTLTGPRGKRHHLLPNYASQYVFL